MNGKLPSRLYHIYAFTIALHSFLSCTSTLPSSTDILLAINTFLHSVHPSHLWSSSWPYTFHIRSSYLLHQTRFFHSLHMLNYHNTPCYAHSANSLTTPVLLHTSSFLSRSILVTPHILLGHLFSITFNLLCCSHILSFSSTQYS